MSFTSVYFCFFDAILRFLDSRAKSKVNSPPFPAEFSNVDAFRLSQKTGSSITDVYIAFT